MLLLYVLGWYYTKQHMAVFNTTALLAAALANNHVFKRAHTSQQHNSQQEQLLVTAWDECKKVYICLIKFWNTKPMLASYVVVVVVVVALLTNDCWARSKQKSGCCSYNYCLQRFSNQQYEWYHCLVHCCSLCALAYTTMFIETTMTPLLYVLLSLICKPSLHYMFCFCFS